MKNDFGDDKFTLDSVHESTKKCVRRIYKNSAITHIDQQNYTYNLILRPTCRKFYTITSAVSTALCC
jgi:hypothetical protein